MSAWIRSDTGRAYHFRTPEREVDRAAWPFPSLTRLCESAGCELVEETSQGFATFKRMMPNDYRMDMLLEEYWTGFMTAVCAFCKRRVPTRGHHVVPRCKGGRDTAPTLPLLRGSSTKLGRTTNCGIRSIPSRKSKPIPDFRSSSAGDTSSRTPPFSGLGETGPEPVRRTGNIRRLLSLALLSP